MDQTLQLNSPQYCDPGELSSSLDDATVAHMLYLTEARESVRSAAINSPFELLAKGFTHHDTHTIYTREHVQAHMKSADLMWDRYVRSYILTELDNWETSRWYYHAEFEDGQAEVAQDSGFFRLVGDVCKRYYDPEVAQRLLNLDLPYAKAQRPQKLRHGYTTSAWAQALCLSRIMMGYVRKGDIDLGLIKELTTKISSLVGTDNDPDNPQDHAEMREAAEVVDALFQKSAAKL